MAAFPILRDIFGVPVDRIDAAAIQRAIDKAAAEGDQLDWKSEPYKPKVDDDELAKDLAAMANHQGGVIVIGVADDGNDQAAGPTPTTDDVAEIKKYIDRIRHARIRPFLPDLTVRAIANGDGRHFVVIAIGRSFDAPHAVVPDSPKASHFRYPIRVGRDTSWMTEQQVAGAYRARFAATAGISEQVTELHERGSRRLTNADNLGWVSVACVPTTLGARVPGPAARAAEVEFLRSWLTTDLRSGKSPEQPGLGGIRFDDARPAVGRTVFTDRHDHNLANGSHVELAHNGGGFAAGALAPQKPVEFAATVPDNAVHFWFSTVSIEWRLFTLLTLLADHARDTGAGGDLELRAQLHIPDRRYSNLCKPKAQRDGFFKYDSWHAFQPVSTTQSTTATLPLGGERDHQLTAAATFELATDIFAEFAFDEPRIFDHTGRAHLDNLGHDLTFGGVAAWCEQHVNRAGDEPASE
ncbi:AlbA family DNA-binding domain-containing protein [Williamsia sp. MIQD14]|uniref:AlbA family DNA-binding domain-containing protein n=1 Tax=Williamsia sp. MIQD14 TaxID=3425703 RepID=UPI003DA042E4